MLSAQDWLVTRHSEKRGIWGLPSGTPVAWEEGKEEAGNALPSSNRSATVGK